MQNLINKIKVIFKDPILRKDRLHHSGPHPLPRAWRPSRFRASIRPLCRTLLNSSQLFGFLNIFSGGGLSNLSIVMLGVGPFITGSIIIQVLTMVFPKWKALMHEEGEAGRNKLSQYSRLLAVPLGILARHRLPHPFRVAECPAAPLGLRLHRECHHRDRRLDPAHVARRAGLRIRHRQRRLAHHLRRHRSPPAVGFVQNYQKLASSGFANLPFYIIVLAVAVLAVAGVVYVTEAERSVPVTYAKQVRGNKVYGGASTYLPLRLNQSGVIPIIFAFPSSCSRRSSSMPLAKWAAHPLIASWSQSWRSSSRRRHGSTASSIS
jgi:preprotein translocase subunit SecY